MAKSPKMLEADDLYDIVKTVQGRRALGRYIALFGYFDDTFHVDPYHHAKKAGMRSAAVMMVEELQRLWPAQWNMLLNERSETLNAPKQREPEDAD